MVFVCGDARAMAPDAPRTTMLATRERSRSCHMARGGSPSTRIQKRTAHIAHVGFPQRKPTCLIFPGPLFRSYSSIWTHWDCFPSHEGNSRNSQEYSWPFHSNRFCLFPMVLAAFQYYAESFLLFLDLIPEWQDRFSGQQQVRTWFGQLQEVRCNSQQATRA